MKGSFIIYTSWYWNINAKSNHSINCGSIDRDDEQERESERAREREGERRDGERGLEREDWR